MRLSRTQNRIRELMTIFVTHMKGSAAQNDTYVHQLAEDVLVPIMRLACGWENLRNLNVTERRNYPAIDLADDTELIAIQVTVTPGSDKIKETLEKFVRHQLYKTYDRLIVYILTERQNTYSGRGFEDIVQNQFSFDKNDDIWDYRDLLKRINSVPLEIAIRIEHILDAHFANGPIIPGVAETVTKTESAFLNLLEMTLPEKLYIAPITVEREAVIKASRQGRIRLKRNSPAREVMRAAMEQQDLRFGTDWVVHEGKIITFHDLSDTSIDLHYLIDEGALEVFTPAAFYEIDTDYERVFKRLLWRTLQQILYHRGVSWQNQDKLFIFVPHNDEPIRMETWQGRSRGERRVYFRKMKDNKPDEALRHEHFGFQIQFKRFGHEWYLLIQPEWFASFDGYRKDSYGNFVEYKKRTENNQQVSTHARFIAYFLSDTAPIQLDMFHNTSRGAKPFLTFGEFVTFDNLPLLDDDRYLPSKKADTDDGTISHESDNPQQMKLLD